MTTAEINGETMIVADGGGVNCPDWCNNGRHCDGTECTTLSIVLTATAPGYRNRYNTSNALGVTHQADGTTSIDTLKIHKDWADCCSLHLTADERAALVEALTGPYPLTTPFAPEADLYED